MPESDVFTLVVLETVQIQQYIFNSNRLKENVGASYLVAAATEDWVYQAVDGWKHNLRTDGFDNQKRIEDGKLDVEILYCGGGNAVLLFRKADQAKEFVRKLSRRAILEAPGLRLTFYKSTVNWSEGNEFEENDKREKFGLAYAVSDALGKLKAQRSHQPPRMGISGLGVTAMCASTSFPATMMDKDPEDNWQVISSEVQAKRAAAPKANVKLEKDLRLPYNFTFPYDLDKLGRSKHESSFIAVVHADGNDMGMLIQGIKKGFSKPKADNRKYIEKMRDLSEEIKKAAIEALHQMLQRLIDAIDMDTHCIPGLHNQADIHLKLDENDKLILPFRPLVFGGDDITFVCDGRIGLDMAVQFIKAFEDATKTHLALENGLTACAGAAIVNAHYPFARAYELAEELCQSAKKARHESGWKQSSLIDWHYTTGGLYDELKEMRKREYQVDLDATNVGYLYLRPLFLDDKAHPYRTWSFVQRFATEFQTAWGNHRSKAKELMDALRNSAIETHVFKTRYLAKSAEVGKALKIPYLPEGADFHDYNGWKSTGENIQIDGQKKDIQRCGYYDALELMDLYIPLTSTQQEAEHVSEN